MLILKNTCASILTMLADIQTSVKHSYIMIKVIIKAFDACVGFVITDKSMIDSTDSSLHFSAGLVCYEQAQALNSVMELYLLHLFLKNMETLRSVPNK